MTFDLRTALAPVWRGDAYWARREPEAPMVSLTSGPVAQPPTTSGTVRASGVSVDPDGRLRSMRSDEEARRWAAERADVLAWLPQSCSVYDLGCGDGKLKLARPDVLAVGFDPDPEAMGAALRRGTRGLSEGWDPFDALWCCHVVEHMDDPLTDLRDGIDRVRPGGIIIVETPDFGSPVALEWQERFRLLHDPTHVSLFTSESLVRMLRALGVVVEEVAWPGWFGTPLAERAIELRGRAGSEVHHVSEDPVRVSRVSPPAPGNVVAVRGRKR